MWRTIYRLRKKSKAEKNKYAFFSAVSFTGMVALLWLVAVAIDLTGEGQNGESAQSAAPIFSSFFSSAKKELEGLKGDLQALATEAERASTSTATSTATTTLSTSSMPLPDAGDLILGSSSAAQATSSTGTTTGEPSKPPPPGPPPGRSTGREVRIATSSEGSTNGP